MSLWRYAADSVRHNGRRTFSSILGVLLAVTFVSGTLIAIDSSTRATLDGMLANIPGDLSLTRSTGSTFDVGAFRDNIASLAGVQDVDLYREQYIWGVTNNTSMRYPIYADLVGIDPAHVPSPLRNVANTGGWDVPNGSALVSDAFAASLGLHRGDSIFLQNQVYTMGNTTNYTVSLTIVGLLGAVPPTSSCTNGYCMPGPFYNPDLIVVRFENMPWILRGLSMTAAPYDLAGQIWIDRLYYVNPYDTAASKTNIARLVYRIQSLLFGYGYVADNLSSQLDAFQSVMTGLRIEFLLLSTPVILLGVYLGAIGVDLSHAERRRELAILKTRGASRSQLVRLLLSESIFGGLVAAVLGLAAGILLSRFLLGVVNPYAGLTARPGDFLVTRDTVLTVVLLSVALMALVTFRSARRTASLPVVETLRYYAPGETKTGYNPRLDIVLLGVGILCYALVVYQAMTAGGLFTFLVGPLLGLALPFVPILIIIGATRLATRSTTKVYELTSRACEPLAKNMHHIIRRNLSRNPRRASNIAIIIALGLGFGVFTLSFFASSQLNQTMQLRASLGADIVVQRYPYYVPGGYTYTPDPGFAANLSAVPGVKEVTRLTSLGSVYSYVTPSPSPYYGSYQSVQYFGLDPQSYFNVTQPDTWYFTDGDAAPALAALEVPGQVLVTQYLADATGIVPGVAFPLYMNIWNSTSLMQENYYLNVTVAGIVRALPGLPGSAFGGYGWYGFGPTSNVYAVYGSHATFQKFENLSSSQGSSNDAYFISLVPNADWKTAKEDMMSLGGSNVQVYQEQLEMLQGSIGAQSTNGFMAMEVAFIVVILTAGLCLILYAATLERDTEFAAIIARGATGWQTAGILVGEGFSILLVGLAVGAGMGVLTAFIETDLLYAGIGSQFTPLVPLLFVLPPDVLLLLVLAPVAMFVGALIVSVRVARMNVARVLKMRGG